MLLVCRSLALPINNVHATKQHGSIEDVEGEFGWVKAARNQFPSSDRARFQRADSGLLYGDYQLGKGEPPARGDLARVLYKAYRVGEDGAVLAHLHSDVAEASTGDDLPTMEPGFLFSVGTGRTNWQALKSRFGLRRG